MNALNARNAFSTQIIVALLLALAMPRLAEAGSNGSQKAVGPEAQQKLAKVQIPFIPNRGQSSKEVKFTARTFAGTVSVTETGGLVYSLPKLEGEKPVGGVALKEELIGGKVKEVIGESQGVTKVSYFRGNDRSKWQSNLPSYDRVSLGEVYRGIEVKLKAYGNNVEKLFYVKPGAEPETIKMRLSGGKHLSINQRGELEVESTEGAVRFSKPIAYQERRGNKEPVEVAYQVRGNEYGFKVGDYDQTRELVIDPILAATYLGAFNGYFWQSIALDSTGNVYVVGSGASGFEGPGSADSEAVGGDVFVATLNSDLTSVLAATFLGGSNTDQPSGNALALDNTGNVYVCGVTASADFPGIGLASADSTFAGREIFVTKLNSDLSSIIGATFLGGRSEEGFFNAIAIDSTGNVYVAGSTSSPDFPGLGPGSADITFAGSSEGFVAKLNSNLSSILSATFLGGNGYDTPWAVSIDGNDSVYVAGDTTSSDFPGVGPGSADKTIGGYEGFVAKLSPDLSSIFSATFLGGSQQEGISSAVVDSVGNIYVAGSTWSSDFPGIGPMSADSRLLGISDGFVAKLNSDLSSILSATLLGGSTSQTSVVALVLDGEANVYVSGGTGSPDLPGVGPNSADSTFVIEECYVAKLKSDLSSILAATFLGGNGYDDYAAMALDSKGNVYVSGGTQSSDFPGLDPGSVDSTFSGAADVFVAKLDANLSSGLQLVSDKVSFVVQNTSLSTTPVSGGPAGVYTITARLSNKTQQSILEPIKTVVTTLTNGNKLLSATEGAGGVGSQQAIDAGTDDILKPNESVTVQFRIGLANRNRFTFFVDIWGPSTEDDRP